MQTIRLGQSALTASRLAYGCWRIAGTWDAARVTPEAEAGGRKSVIAAFEAGYTLFDLADIYCEGASEKIFGQALKETASLRKRALILQNTCFNPGNCANISRALTLLSTPAARPTDICGGISMHK